MVGTRYPLSAFPPHGVSTVLCVLLAPLLFCTVRAASSASTGGCGPAPIVPHAIALSSDTGLGAKVRYECTEGYVNKRRKRNICRTNGWSDRVVCSPDESTCGISAITPRSVRIVEGSEAEPHSWPWMVRLQRNGKHRCGGSVISKRWIVTAAHCVHEESASIFSIIAGDHSKNSQEPTEQILHVNSITEHRFYDTKTLDNDIALLYLAADLNWTQAVKPICLPQGDAATNTTCVITGWGHESYHGTTSIKLRQAEVPIIDPESCKAEDWYGSDFTDTMICAGYPEGKKDACQEDSGGPLMCQENGVYRLHGVTSWGHGCADPKHPGVYTRMASMVDWMNDITSPPVTDNCENNPCVNGVCINGISSYTCTCTEGFSGPNCNQGVLVQPNNEEGYDCSQKNPCTQQQRDVGKYHFPHVNANNFVQCDAFGGCFIMPCPRGLRWNIAAVTCTY